MTERTMSFFEQVLVETAVAAPQQPVDRALVEQLLVENYGLRGHLEPIATEKDDTFRLRDDRDYLVKCSPATEDPELVDLQTAAMVHLEVTSPDLPVQRVIPTRDSAREVVIPGTEPYPRILRVLSYVPGDLLKDGARTATHWSAAGKMLGRLTVAMEGFSHPRDKRRLLWDMGNFDKLSELLTFVDDEPSRTLADAVFAEYCDTVAPRLDDLERQVIHGDFSPYNAVVDSQDPQFVTGIIDFGDVVHTCVAFDVAVGMANLIGVDETDPWGHALDFLDGYLETRPLPADAVELLREIALGRLLLRALVVRWRAHGDPERHAYLVTHAARDWTYLRRAHEVDAGDVRSRLRAAAERSARRGEAASVVASDNSELESPEGAHQR
ncbi:phosphotransferase [Gordonia sp. zg691]|uniref:phosphotransferase n=1 Tax=Gordonia jinghuaiqii TaxID=2758710 RepID=UPI0016627194|nr:phosphotransferase [Gordonia jinghuaiqii]MBD0861952.1 phosphotransferase [Gordonia jinghuaiqii]